MHRPKRGEEQDEIAMYVENFRGSLFYLQSFLPFSEMHEPWTSEVREEMIRICDILYTLREKPQTTSVIKLYYFPTSNSPTHPPSNLIHEGLSQYTG